MVVVGAFGMIGVIIFLGVVLQLGMVYTQRRHLQNTADAAALAGAQELDGTAVGAELAIEAAEEWAEHNTSGLTLFEPQVNEANTEIRVRVAKPISGISNVLGLGSPHFTAKATAGVVTLNTLSPCVVPLGIQDSIYQDAYQKYEDGEDDLVVLKVAVQSGDSGSNTGLINITTGNLANDFRFGVCNLLTPTIDTKPGYSGGDVGNGIQDRLEAAQDAGCYTYEQVTDPANHEKCIPPLFELGTEIQATAVIRVPILATDIVEAGAHGVPIAPASEPNGWYLLADFWIDGDSMYDQSNPHNWQCFQNPECPIYGRFLFNVPAPLNVWDPDLC
ncbi:MAG: pilus assembly protein TadG-related protein, partial [Dehalococcoidia bacterium]